MSDQTAFIQQLATLLRQYRLEQISLFFLELGRPFTFLGGQFLWVAQPALSLVVSRQSVGQFAALLEEPLAVDQLIQELEATVTP